MSAPTPGPRQNRYGGLFWPGALIVIGILALVVNTGVIPADRLYRLGDLWPLVLIVIGLLILIGRSGLPSPTSLIAGGLVVLLAIVGAGAYVATGPAFGTASFDASHVAGQITSASAEINVGGATINVSGDSSIGTDLYRAHVEYTGRKPDVRFDESGGVLRISQNGSSGIFTPTERLSIDLRLNTSVSWALTVNAGGTSETMNLAQVDLRSMELNSGGSSGDITLGQPHGSVAITISGGGLTMHLHRPSGVAASVNVSGAAVSLTFDGRRHGGLGSVSDSSPGGSDRYDVTVSGAGCTVTMDTSG